MSYYGILPQIGRNKGRYKNTPLRRHRSALEKAEARNRKEEKQAQARINEPEFKRLTSAIRDTKLKLSSHISVCPHQFVADLTACRPNAHPDTPYGFKWSYLLDSIMSKYPHNPSGVSAEDRAKKAVEKMLISDDRCLSKNRDGFGSHDQCNIHIRRVLGLAREYVHSILGEFTNDIYKKARFTGGASYCFTRRHGDAYYKYNSDELSVTPRAWRHVESLINCTPLWRQIRGSRSVKLVPGDRTSTVEKNADIDRAIRLQPEGNLLLQLCLGSHMRQRLKLYGIDLRDQGVNQRFAKKGSIDGSIATIDWSSASDSISDLLVFSLVPDRWYQELDMARCSRGWLPDGTLRTWGGFSAMGNGFTFELESIIFYSITLACTYISGGDPTLCSIYGDDTICPSEAAPLLMDVMSDLGFLPNRDKTFSTGPFRESCGKHYYNGVDVTPFYIRDHIDDHSRVCWLLNRLRAWADDGTGVCDPSVYKLWLKYRRKYIPDQLLGGCNLDEVIYVVSPEEARLRIVATEQTRPIDGISALLRSMQGAPDQSAFGIGYNTIGLNRSFYSSYRYRYSKYRIEALTFLDTVRVSVDSQKIIDQRSVLCLGIKPNKEWYTPIPLFPNEFRD